MKEGLGVQKKSQLHTGSAESEEGKKRAEKTKIGEKKGGDREWRGKKRLQLQWEELRRASRETKKGDMREKNGGTAEEEEERSVRVRGD